MNILVEKSYTSIIRFSKRIFAFLTPKKIALIAIALGFFLRLVHYSLDRSLWIDESFVALNILDRSIPELFEPLKYNQAAPIGFLVIVKLNTLIFGDSEYSLRLFPFLSAVVSLLLFYRVANWFGSPAVLAVSLSLFALSDRAIYYSAELKQYSSDLAFSLGAYCLAIELQKNKLSLYKIALFSILGAIFVWFSHPVVFVLSGTGITLLISAYLQKDKIRIRNYLIVFIVWAVSFLSFYQISLTKLIGNQDLQSSWQDSHNSFVPLPPTNLPEAKWFVDKFFEVFNYPVGISLTGIAALAFITGCIYFFDNHKEKFFLLFTPVLMTAIASGLHKYPFKGQLLLFMIPVFILAIARGTIAILNKTKNNYRILGIIFVVLLYFYPLYYVVLNLNNPDKYPAFEYQRVREDIKPVLSYVRKNYQQGDVIYLYYATQYAFKYYFDRYNFTNLVQTDPIQSKAPKNWFEPALPSYPPKLIVGKYSRNNWQIFVDELAELKGSKRVWLIFSHAVDRRTELDEEDVFLNFADRVGTQLDRFNDVEANAYLYDFSN